MGVGPIPDVNGMLTAASNCRACEDMSAQQASPNKDRYPGDNNQDAAKKGCGNPTCNCGCSR